MRFVDVPSTLGTGTFWVRDTVTGDVVAGPYYARDIASAIAVAMCNEMDC